MPRGAPLSEPTSSINATHDGLGATGEMADRVRRHDWMGTPLGHIDQWPQSLKTTTGLLLASPIPMVMLWGVEGVMIYNDAYAVFAGGRHPRLLGSNVREGWPEVADFNDNVMTVGLAGGTLAYKDQELTLHRSGMPEQVWMDLDYWPVPGEDGAPAGVIATVVETTARVVAERQREADRERLELALSAGRGVGTWDWDVAANRVFADKRFARLYGVDPVKARRGAPIEEFFGSIHPDDAGRVHGLIDHSVKTGDLFNAEYRLVQPDGSVRWVAAEGRCSLSPDGSPERFPGVTFDVSDRHAATHALALSETRYRTLFDNIASGLCIVQMKFDEAGRAVDYMIVEGNAAFEEMTGLVNANGKWVSDIAPGLEQHWFDLYGGVARTGISAHFENPADIFGRWYEGQALRIGDPAENRIAILFNNITPQKQAETRQRVLLDLNDAVRDLTDPAEIAHASSRILAEALNVSRVGYGVMDTVAETVTIERDYNAPGIKSIAGVIQFRDFGSYIENLVRGEVVVFADGGLDPRISDGGAALDTISARSLINLPLMEQGKVVALLFVNNATPRVWSDGDVALVREVAERVRVATERARATDALRESEARFRNMADNAPMMMWVTDPTGHCQYLNKTWYDFTGQTEEEAEGFGWLDATHPDDKARTEKIFVDSNAAQVPFKAEYRLRRADGVYRWAIDAASPRFGADGRYLGYVGSVIDIDERREIEDALRATDADLRELNATLEERVVERTHELQAAHEALRQSQKMEAVGQLTGGIAHDFNNLLAGISGALELLSKRLAEGRLNGMDRYIDAAQGSAQRAASLTQRLLAFSRRQTLDPKPTDVNRLIGGMEDLVRRSVGPNVEVEVVGAGGLWPTLIDPSQLENALLNLCINARDAMAPDGGRLTIETANKWLDDRAARERELLPGQYVTLCVTDTGTGMSPEVQAQAFDPFFTTKPLGQGTGLGLSMIHGFVRQSNGQIRIYSEPGSGTTMCLYLPRFGGQLDDGAAVGDAPVAEGGHGETVLVIDDEETVRMLVAEVLGEAGYHVIEAPDGPSGLEILRSDRRIDLLVSDVGLPGGMNGRQVADAARVDRPDLKVLFITGYAENAAVGNGLLAPGMEVLTKPFVMAELALKVHEMIEG
ncbi:PAS domain S-box protein [Brevundimonas sp.]